MNNAPITKKEEEEEQKAINLPADTNKDSKKDEAGKSAPGSDKK